MFMSALYEVREVRSNDCNCMCQECCNSLLPCKMGLYAHSWYYSFDIHGLHCMLPCYYMKFV